MSKIRMSHSEFDAWMGTDRMSDAMRNAVYSVVVLGSPVTAAAAKYGVSRGGVHQAIENKLRRSAENCPTVDRVYRIPKQWADALDAHVAAFIIQMGNTQD